MMEKARRARRLATMMQQADRETLLQYADELDRHAAELAGENGAAHMQLPPTAPVVQVQVQVQQQQQHETGAPEDPEGSKPKG